MAGGGRAQINVDGRLRRFTLHHVLEFDPVRRRMGVIVEDEAGASPDGRNPLWKSWLGIAGGVRDARPWEGVVGLDGVKPRSSSGSEPPAPQAHKVEITPVGFL